MTHAVNNTLRLGRRLVRSVSLNRSVNRPTFTRSNRGCLSRLCRGGANECFVRGVRSIEILSGVCPYGLAVRALSNVTTRGNRVRLYRCCPTGLSNFQRFSRVVREYYISGTFTDEVTPSALRNTIIGVSSVVTCVNGSERSTVVSGTMARGSFCGRSVNTAGTRVVGGLVIGVVRGDCNGPCVGLSRGRFRTLEGSGGSGCRGVCGRTTTSTHLSVAIGPVVTSVCKRLLRSLGLGGAGSPVCAGRVGCIGGLHGDPGAPCRGARPGRVIISFVTDVASSCFVRLRGCVFPGTSCPIICEKCFSSCRIGG